MTREGEFKIAVLGVWLQYQEHQNEELSDPEGIKEICLGVLKFTEVVGL